MKEAHNYQSPLVYGIVRRIEMTKYVFNKKIWHKSAKWTAKARALWLVLIGHEAEMCLFCGGRVAFVWWCQDSILWTKLTGWQEGGICCMKCFDTLATKAGILLVWSPNPHSQSSKTDSVREALDSTWL